MKDIIFMVMLIIMFAALGLFIDWCGKQIDDNSML